MSELSYIAPEKEAEVRALVEKELGVPLPRMCGYKICVKIFVNDEEAKARLSDGSESKILLPSVTKSNDPWRNCTGQVIGMGPDAYQHEKFKSGPWCKVGDYVVIPRHAGMQYKYRGFTVHSVNDDAIDMVIEDPTHVIRD